MNTHHPDVRTLAFRILTQPDVVQKSGLEAQRVQRVSARLQAGRRPGDRVRVRVVADPEEVAFNAIGGYVYITDALVRRCTHDDALAMVLAHEIAHFDLVHPDVGTWREAVLATELAADHRALELCSIAGFDAARCMDAFDIIRAISVTHRHVPARIAALQQSVMLYRFVGAASRALSVMNTEGVAHA
jgi:hypothetical protein